MFSHLLCDLNIGNSKFKYFNLLKLDDKRYERLPYSIRVLLETAIRNCDNFQVSTNDVEKILNWEVNQHDSKGIEVPFKPARVILQDFTGVPAVVDFAAMRDAVKQLGGDPAKINPICPADLVIDHSVQVDFSRTRIRELKEAETAQKTSRRPPIINWRNVRDPRHGTQRRDFQSLPSSRPLSPQSFSSCSSFSQHSLASYSSRPTSPVYQPPNCAIQPYTGMVIQPPPPPPPTSPGYVSYIVRPVQNELPITPHGPVLYPQTTYYAVTPCQAVLQPVAQPVMQPLAQPIYYSSPTNLQQPCSNDCQNSCTSQKNSSCDIEDLTARFSKARIDTKRCRSSSSKLSESDPPPLRIPVASLPCPQDAPGIPIQDTVCPFHKESSTWSDALHRNEQMEFERNKERFLFLKWGSKALKNMMIVPPGSGIVHQVNLEYLARVVFDEDGVLYPDSLVGTDSHTTMINGLGVLGWGVGGIEAEAVMLGQAISMVLPQVIGYKIIGKLSPLATSTDVVLTITKHLRQIGVVGKFVEFFGDGVEQLSLADRATVSNMCPEYGATIGYFPVDETTLQYLKQSNRSDEKITAVEAYLKAVKMFRNFSDSSQDPVFTQVVELDLADVVPSVSGPKRPHDRVPVSDMKDDFRQCLSNKVGFKGFGIKSEDLEKVIQFSFDGEEFSLQHGAVVIAAITSCTNTSNPSVMLGAGLLAKKAVEAGLKVAPYIKTSLSPGSGVVTHYLQHSGVTPFLEKLGFDIVGYGCMTCIGNSGPLPDCVSEAIEKGDLVCCGILSGNRNFEGRIHPNTRANYLASPLLVIAYALAGTVDIDFELEPIGKSSIDGHPVFLRDIWPSRSDIQRVESESVLPSMFSQVYKSITCGNENWNSLEAPAGLLYPWSDSSTYIKNPPFFENMTKEIPPFKPIVEAHVLLNLGDSVTTDHISPAGSIARNSPAARYLAAKGLTPREFNSYGSRRGNDAVMARGTFANVRLVNKFLGRATPRTIHVPSGEEMDIFDAAERYKSEGRAIIILAGKEYGSGSSRDWAAKGPFLLGVRAVIAESFERIHRSNLVGMGIIPLQYVDEGTPSTLTGKETFTIDLNEDLQPGMIVDVKVSDGRTFAARLRFDTEVELVYFRHGGILNYMIRKMAEN